MNKWTLPVSAFFGIFMTVAFLFAGEDSSSLPIGKNYPPTTNFTAQWINPISLPDPIVPNLWLVYRKTFTLEKAPTSALCRLAADSKFWLYVNGEMVLFEGGLKRGPTINDSYYDEIDLAPYLKPGKNVIAARVWFFGKDAFSHVDSGRPGFFFDSNPNNGIFRLTSDATWKAVLYSAMPNISDGPYEITTADPQPNFRLAESNVRFDARRDFDGDWTSIDFDDSAWPNAAVCGQAGSPPWGNLYARPIPLFKDFGLTDYENADEIPAVSTGEPIHCHLPYNAQVTPWLSIDAEPGLEIDIRTDDYQGGNAFNVRGEYVTKEGTQTYESLGWMNGQEVIYTIPKGVKINALKYRQSGYATEIAGRFDCDDPFFNKYWTMAARTLYITMRDTYFDCPDRERSQWWGDAVNELGEAFYAMDRRADLLPRKGFYELIRFQKENGALYSPVPSRVWNQELPAQMLTTIGTCGLGTYAWFSGDLATPADLYPGLKRYLAVWKLDEKGLVIPRDGDWSWGDWGENIDLRPLMNCWFYLAVKEASVIAASLGLSDEVRDYNAIMAGMEKSFNAEFWTGKDYRDPNYQKESDDRTAAMAVIAGLATPDQFPALRELFKTAKHASPYMEKYVLEALFIMGYPDDALARLKERFAEMVNHPTLTTLWEGWSIGSRDFGGGTINHAWSGGGLTALAQYAVGLYPIQPGFQKSVVMPQPGPLKNLVLTTVTRFGQLAIRIQNEADSFKMTITVPPGATVLAGVPAQFEKVSVQALNSTPEPRQSLTKNADDDADLATMKKSLPTNGAARAFAERADDYHFYPLGQGTFEISTE